MGVLRSIGIIAGAGMGKAYAGNSPTVETEHIQAVLTLMLPRESRQDHRSPREQCPGTWWYNCAGAYTYKERKRKRKRKR